MSPRTVFEQELKELADSVALMGNRLREGYGRLAAAVTAWDREAFSGLLDNDRQMTELQRSIEAQCLTILARQQPVARDLRLVSAALKAVTDMERVGDHVADMAELFLRLESYNVRAMEELQRMLSLAGEMLKIALEAFAEGDTDKARIAIEMDDQVDAAFNRVKEDLLEAIRSREEDADRTVDLLMIAKYLEKTGDHAVNIGEWAIFRKTGDLENYRLL